MAKFLMVTWTRWGKAEEDSDDQDELVNAVLSQFCQMPRVDLLPISLQRRLSTFGKVLYFADNNDDEDDGRGPYALM
jgi:hypothetical protein